MRYVARNVALFFLGGLMVFFGFAALRLIPVLKTYAVVAPAFADDENEDRDTGERENTSTTPTGTTDTTSSAPAPKKKTTKTVPVTKDVITYRPVTKMVTVTDPGYDTDIDNDGLVDALDPDPTRPQSEYFTDIDGDGVPNAFDAHHDEDDFAYFVDETDTNQNGVIDSYE